MKLFATFILTASFLATMAQSPQTPLTPDQLYGGLFTAVQMQRVFDDGKTFVDCIPKRSAAEIVSDYAVQKNKAGFKLKTFVLANFTLPPAPPQLNYIRPEKDALVHMTNLWGTLRREPDKAVAGSSLLPLPYPYIVPGGRFREIYYWDSYFTMLGLKEHGQTEMIENMVKNFTFLINTYGHIPNGNRSYYVSRSQPPFFGLMVELLASIKGDEVYKTYLPALEKEHAWWMHGSENLLAGETAHSVVKMPGGEILNRYWDELATPRPESYLEDVVTADTFVMNKMAPLRFRDKASMDRGRKTFYEQAYRNLRAAAASGLDFSTRWFADNEHITTIETTDIVPVDLNSLLYKMELIMAKSYDLQQNGQKSKYYSSLAAARMQAIEKYCYNTQLQYFCDYHIIRQQVMDKITPAGMFPFALLDEQLLRPKMKGAVAVVKKYLLKDGGITTSINHSGQQWDAPNGWAPMQWMTIWGLERCGEAGLAKEIASRWIKLNLDVYGRTGKLMEKYNVENTTLEAGGGEYPAQDGFGWTNGVLIALMKKYGFRGK